MDIFEQILENLELERELGTRTVEIDRALLVPPSDKIEAKTQQRKSIDSVASTQEKTQVQAPKMHSELPKNELPVSSRESSRAEEAANTQSASSNHCDIVFYTGRQLSPAGMAAMEKIFDAIKKIKAGIAISLNEPCKAKVCVLLGSDALKKYLPTGKPIRGNWEVIGGMPAIMTFSPDYIFAHFSEGSPRMKEAKLVMWNDIKSAVARI
jgi:hypothetical protein